MKTTALIVLAFFLGAGARAEDSPGAQFRLIERDLYEAFVTGRSPDPARLDVPALRHPSRFQAEERTEADALIRLARQVAGIQEGTDGSEPALNIQRSNIRRTARAFERRLRVADGMPPEPVVKMYEAARRAIAGSSFAAAAVALPDANKARVARLLDGNIFGGPPGSGFARAGVREAAPSSDRPGVEGPLKASDFRPPVHGLGVKSPSLAAVGAAEPDQSVYRRLMGEGYRAYALDQALVERGMAEYKDRRVVDCGRALSSACAGNTAMLGYGYVKTFLNAAGMRLTGAEDAGTQAKEAGKLAVELSPIGGVRQIADDVNRHGLGHFASPANIGIAIIGFLPYGRTVGQMGASVRAVGRGEGVMVEAGRVGRTALDDTFGAASRTSVLAAQSREVQLAVRGARELDPAALREFGRSAAAHYSEPWSLAKPGVRRADGIVGAHEEELFRAALAEARGATTLERSVPGFPGMKYVEYRLQKTDGRGGYLPELKNRVYEKTIVDPKVWPQERLAELAGTLFGSVGKDGMHFVHHKGVTFVGWIRDGKLASFGADSWAGKPSVPTIH